MNMNLKMERFEPYLQEKKSRGGGIRYRFKFPNNYGASVVKGPWTYGGRDDLWELAVLTYDGDEWKLTYDTEITDDVIGYLEDEEVLELLQKIQDLK